MSLLINPLPYENYYNALSWNELKNNDNSDSRKIKDLVSEITSIVENKILDKKFPNELISITIEDVSFQEIPFGKFNMFNAFFNNLTIDEIKNNNYFNV